ncbi:MAG: hypothetical protein Q8L60_01780 [Gammaproteobacteria bacterium]|nr:hypothetical protein [Gammaproteobacteria bacterium]MDP2348621.1 hypothetical protein [Gammaproteobacteria bacterium]
MKTFDTKTFHMKTTKRFSAVFVLLLSIFGTALFALAGATQAQLQIAQQEIVEISRKCVFGDCINGEGALEITTTIGLNTYRGNFKDGKYDGYGKLTEMVSRSERAYYDGLWSDGIRNGRGTYWNGRGNLYIGEWRDDKRHGRGSYFFGVRDWTENKYSEHWLSENVENYTGGFLNDLYHGSGTYRWPNGQKYVGEFFANDKHGPGTFYYPRGSVRQQVWEYGKLVPQ